MKHLLIASATCAAALLASCGDSKSKGDAPLPTSTGDQTPVSTNDKPAPSSPAVKSEGAASESPKHLSNVLDELHGTWHKLTQTACIGMVNALGNTEYRTYEMTINTPLISVVVRSFQDKQCLEFNSETTALLAVDLRNNPELTLISGSQTQYEPVAFDTTLENVDGTLLGNVHAGDTLGMTLTYATSAFHLEIPALNFKGWFQK
ncbi:MAG: hypothetical protein JST16_09885 [Bdellovibrionales bacterium]|nr:hypothetical protein [Bdellovibrionales bacterium]